MKEKEPLKMKAYLTSIEAMDIALELLNDEELRSVLKGISTYLKTNEEPQFESKAANVIYNQLMQTVNSGVKTYKKRREHAINNLKEINSSKKAATKDTTAPQETSETKIVEPIHEEVNIPEEKPEPQKQVNEPVSQETNIPQVTSSQEHVSIDDEINELYSIVNEKHPSDDTDTNMAVALYMGFKQHFYNKDEQEQKDMYAFKLNILREKMEKRLGKMEEYDKWHKSVYTIAREVTEAIKASRIAS